MTARTPMIYGTCVALGPVAALLQGPSGSGKSDLALRFMMLPPTATDAPATRLVADDQVLLSAEDGRVIARPPAALAGKIEVRGLGIIAVPYLAEAELKFVVRLSERKDVPRMPPIVRPTVDLAGVALPVLQLAPFEASAPLKLRLAFMQFAAMLA